MSFYTLLDHTCDIYHTVKNNESPGYNLPASPTFSYPDTPDAESVICHFSVKSSTVTVNQYAPQAKLESRIKLILPISADIRVNDRIVDCDTGYEYTAELPRKVRNHHTFVWITRRTEQEAI